jgi:hypothetical protein
MSNESAPVIATIPAPMNVWDRFNSILPLVQEGLCRNLDKTERSDLLFLIGENMTLSPSAICIRYAQSYSGVSRKGRRIVSFLKKTVHEGAAALADKTE